MTIFVTVGSLPFPRLIEAMDNYAATSPAQVTMQIAHTQYEPRYSSCERFVADFSDYLHRADVVVAHAGIGTVTQLLEVGVPFVLVPRRCSLGEHFDDHQWQFVCETAPELPCTVARDVTDLDGAIASAPARFANVQYQSSRPQLVKAVNHIVRDLCGFMPS